MKKNILILIFLITAGTLFYGLEEKIKTSNKAPLTSGPTSLAQDKELIKFIKEDVQPNDEILKRLNSRKMIDEAYLDIYSSVQNQDRPDLKKLSFLVASALTGPDAERKSDTLKNLLIQLAHTKESSGLVDKEYEEELVKLTTQKLPHILSSIRKDNPHSPVLKLINNHEGIL